MNKELNSIFQDFTKSTFSRADTKYETKRNSSFMEASGESHHDSYYMDSILEENSQLLEINKYADDSFLESTKEKFRALVGKEGKYKNRETIGTHPDFVILGNTDNIENYYAVSMFVDIKNSTLLHDNNIISLWK